MPSRYFLHRHLVSNLKPVATQPAPGNLLLNTNGLQACRKWSTMASSCQEVACSAVSRRQQMILSSSRHFVREGDLNRLEIRDLLVLRIGIDHLPYVLFLLACLFRLRVDYYFSLRISVLENGDPLFEKTQPYWLLSPHSEVAVLSTAPHWMYFSVQGLQVVAFSNTIVAWRYLCDNTNTRV